MTPRLFLFLILSCLVLSCSEKKSGGEDANPDVEESNRLEKAPKDEPLKEKKIEQEVFKLFRNIYK